MMKSKTKFILTLAAVLAISLLGGCNTTAGAGRDMQKAGASLEDSAQKHGAD